MKVCSNEIGQYGVALQPEPPAVRHQHVDFIDGVLSREVCVPSMIHPRWVKRRYLIKNAFSSSLEAMHYDIDTIDEDDQSSYSPTQPNQVRRRGEPISLIEESKVASLGEADVFQCPRCVITCDCLHHSNEARATNHPRTINFVVVADHDGKNECAYKDVPSHTLLRRTCTWKRTE